MEEIPQANPELLQQLVSIPMPFGKYKGTLLCNLPVSYLEWFARKGFPKNKLGMLWQLYIRWDRAIQKNKLQKGWFIF